MLQINAFAKINLFLDILDKRSDGYHDIFTIMQNVTLHDELRFTSSRKIDIRYDSFPGKDHRDDLVLKAWRLLSDYSNQEYSIRIDIKKRIPVAAGLGGGSADAAAALIGLNRFLDIGLTRPDLHGFSRKLGADVPFFMDGGTQVAEGIGDALKTVSALPDCFVVVIGFPISISTAWAYQAVDKIASRPESPEVTKSKILESIGSGDYAGICQNLYNSFEQVVLPEYPEVSQVKKIALKSGADAALMSGSGPSLFCLTKSEDTAQRIKVNVKEHSNYVSIVKPCQRGLKVVE